jgi:hypothetical protein
VGALALSRQRRGEWAAAISYGLLSAWFFAPVLFQGATLFFRDITYSFFPNYLFLEGALRQGVWPLWNPCSDAGAPFAAPAAALYPPDLLLTWLLGARGVLRFGPPLHLWLAMLGAFGLGKTLRLSAWGAWAAGAFYGASGFVLSGVNLLPLVQASAWAPFVVAAGLRLAERPSLRRTACLAALLALAISSLCGEIVLQAMLLSVALLPRWPKGRVAAAALVAAALALLALAPVLLPLWQDLRDSERRRGFEASVALADAASAGVLLEAALPGFFGDVHTMTAHGYWGQPFFPGGFPYLLSLYLGPTLLLLAIRSHAWRLLAIAVLGLLLSLGAHGPFALPLALWAQLFRAPVKFLFLTTLALCLAAGAGFEPSPERKRATLFVLAPGLCLLTAAALAGSHPELLLAALRRLLSGIDSGRALDVIARLWPRALLVTGSVALAAGLALLGPARLRPLAALLALLDLGIVNVAINQAAPASFFELRPETQKLVDKVKTPGPWRSFSVSVESARLHWNAALVARNSDRSLYSLDRQSLMPRTHVIDGLESALDEDRTGFAPLRSTLAPSLREPAAFRAIVPRLRQANVRYVFSFAALAEDLAVPLGEASLPEVAEPLRLYELRGALPRAFFVPEVRRLGLGPGADVFLDEAHLAAINAGGARVEYRAQGPHSVELRAESGPGWIIVLDGFDQRWRVEGGAPGLGPVLRAGERYRAVSTPGGAQVFRLSFREPYLGWAFVLSLLALSGIALGSLAPESPLTPPEATR